MTGSKYREYLDRLLIGDDVEELLTLWGVSQGGRARSERLAMMASLVEQETDRPLRALDLFCGPGDLGRAFAERFARSHIVSLDRDAFLLALCTAANRRYGVDSEAHLRDGWQRDWYAPLGGDFDVVGAATALHWFDVPRLGSLFEEVLGLLRPGGLFVFDEPASLRPGFSSNGYAEWVLRTNLDTPSGDAWSAFWRYAREHFGHVPPATAGQGVIGDDGLPVMQYVQLLRDAGFAEVDVVQRTGGQVTVGALKGNGPPNRPLHPTRGVAARR